MNKDIKDYLHLYLGAMCKWQENGVISTWEIKIDYELLQNADWIKPILRPLTSMTEEDWIKCFELSRGVCDQSYKDKVKQMSSTDVMFTLGKRQFIFGYHTCYDNDVRISGGVCFYLGSYLIKDELSVTESGEMHESESWFNDRKEEQVKNVNFIITYLLSRHFDLFGLIEAGLAIDLTKINTNE